MELLVTRVMGFQLASLLTNVYASTRMFKPVGPVTEIYNKTQPAQVTRIAFRAHAFKMHVPLFQLAAPAKTDKTAKPMLRVLIIPVKTQLVIVVQIPSAASRELLAQLLMELASPRLVSHVLLVISAQLDYAATTHWVVSACKVLEDLARLAPSVSLTTAPVVECAYTTQGDLVHQTLNAFLITAFKLPACLLLASHAYKLHPLSV